MKLIAKAIALLASISILSCTYNYTYGSGPADSKDFRKNLYHSMGAVILKGLDGKDLGSGTAFAVSSKYLITAGHFCKAHAMLSGMGVAKSEVSLVTFAPNLIDLVEDDGVAIIAYDEVNDVCVLEKSGHGLNILHFSDRYEQLKTGDYLVIVGAPLGVMASAFDGVVVSKDEEIGGLPKLIGSMPVTGGNSGSPVLNENGDIVGMLIAGHAAYDHLAVCTPVVAIKRFYDKVLMGLDI